MTFIVMSLYRYHYHSYINLLLYTPSNYLKDVFIPCPYRCHGHCLHASRTGSVASPTSWATNPTSSNPTPNITSSTTPPSCHSLPSRLLLRPYKLLPMRTWQHITGWCDMHCLPTWHIRTRPRLSLMLLLPSWLQLSTSRWDVLPSIHMPQR